jgi:hypothetical protein
LSADDLVKLLRGELVECVSPALDNQRNEVLTQPSFLINLVKNYSRESTFRPDVITTALGKIQESI